MKRREIIKELKKLGYTRREIFAYKVLRFFVSEDDVELNNIFISLSLRDFRRSVFQLREAISAYKERNSICR